MHLSVYLQVYSCTFLKKKKKKVSMHMHRITSYVKIKSHPLSRKVLFVIC